MTPPSDALPTKYKASSIVDPEMGGVIDRRDVACHGIDE